MRGALCCCCASFAAYAAPTGQQAGTQAGRAEPCSAGALPGRHLPSMARHYAPPLRHRRRGGLGRGLCAVDPSASWLAPFPLVEPSHARLRLYREDPCRAWLGTTGEAFAEHGSALQVKLLPSMARHYMVRVYLPRSSTSSGSMRVSNQFMPQCRCGPVARPVAPTAAMVCPCSILSPTFTSIRDRCRKLELMP